MAGDLLYAERRADDQARSKGESLLRLLLATRTDDRVRAAEALRDDLAHSSKDVMSVIVARFAGRPDSPKQLLEDALELRRGSRLRTRSIELVRQDDLVVLTVADGIDGIRDTAEKLLSDLRRDIGTHPCGVGYATPTADFTQAPSLLASILHATPS